MVIGQNEKLCSYKFNKNTTSKRCQSPSWLSDIFHFCNLTSCLLLLKCWVSHAFSVELVLAELSISNVESVICESRPPLNGAQCPCPGQGVFTLEPKRPWPGASGCLLLTLFVVKTVCFPNKKSHLVVRLIDRHQNAGQSYCWQGRWGRAILFDFNLWLNVRQFTCGKLYRPGPLNLKIRHWVYQFRRENIIGKQYSCRILIGMVLLVNWLKISYTIYLHALASIAPLSQMIKQFLWHVLPRSKNVFSIWIIVFRRFSWNFAAVTKLTHLLTKFCDYFRCLLGLAFSSVPILKTTYIDDNASSV